MNVSERLSLDSERVSIAADVYEGFAHVYAKEDDRLQSFALMGSCFTIAASYASVFDPKRAKSLFRTAAGSYAKQAYFRDDIVNRQDQPSRQRFDGKMAFARLLAVCGTDLHQIQSLIDIDAKQERLFRSPDDLASLLLGTTILELAGLTSDAEWMRSRSIEDAYRMESYEVGRLRLPLQDFVRIAELPSYGLQHGPIRETAAALLSRIDETLAGVRKNRLWKLMQTSILPIEPEALALCVTLDVAARHATNNEQNLRDLLGDQNHNISQVYVIVAAEFGQDSATPETQNN